MEAETVAVAVAAPTRAERIASAAVRGMGSLPFIAVQTVIIAAWIALNAWVLGRHAFDPMPFILLNLLFSTQAAYAAPLILLAQNKQAARDEARAAQEAAEVSEIDALELADREILRSVHLGIQLMHTHMGIEAPPDA